MSSRRPLHPSLIALPILAFAVAVIALVVHAATSEIAWYRLALYASVAGVITGAIEAVASYVDASNLPAHTGAREAGFRHAACDVLALVLFAATGAVLYTNLAMHRPLAIAMPLMLALLGLGAMAVSGWYGHAVMQLFRAGQALVRYPVRHVRIVQGHRRSLDVPTIG
jgi:uncharacterized membrane protein